MTPAEHATAAADELNLSAVAASTSSIEATIHAQRAQVHAVLSGKAGTGSNYTAAEAALTASDNPSAARHVVLAQAAAYAALAS